MKSLLLLLFCAILISGCQEKTTTIDERITEYMRANANDPGSYEPLSTVFLDSITWIEYYQVLNSESVDPRMFQPQIDSIRGTGTNPVRHLYYQHSCRLRNGFGALVLKDLYVSAMPGSLIVMDVEEVDFEDLAGKTEKPPVGGLSANNN